MQDIKELERIIGYEFRDSSLISQALNHSSYSREYHAKTGKELPDYERLEFLGDAVLELTASRMLYMKYDWPEGKLTKVRAEIVCEKTLSKIARELGLGRFLNLGKGEEKMGGRDKSSILCDLVEAIIGAVYLDGGMDKASMLIERILFQSLEIVPEKNVMDYKSHLQEVLQGEGRPIPEYRTVSEEGPAHDRTFTMELWLEGRMLVKAEGRSKKQAAQECARLALEKIR